MRCRSKKDGTNDSVSGRSRRPKEASSACHDSLQQMWTLATKTPSSQKHCNFSFFSLNSLPAAPILYSFPLLPLSLSLACSTCRALQTNGACLFRCMDMTTSKTLHAMMAGWRRTVRKRDYLGWGTMPPRIHDGSLATLSASSTQLCFSV